MKGIYICLALLILSTSCGKDEPLVEAFNDDITVKSLSIRLLDSSGGKSLNEVDFQGLQIDLLQVRIKTEGGNPGWVDFPTNAGIYDLVQLQSGADSVIASGNFSGTAVKEIRLVLGESNSVLVDGVWHEIQIPSGSESGLKIKLDPALYVAEMDSLFIDFDSNASVRQQGNGDFKLQPVIRIQ